MGGHLLPCCLHHLFYSSAGKSWSLAGQPGFLAGVRENNEKSARPPGSTILCDALKSPTAETELQSHPRRSVGVDSIIQSGLWRMVGCRGVVCNWMCVVLKDTVSLCVSCKSLAVYTVSSGHSLNLLSGLLAQVQICQKGGKKWQASPVHRRLIWTR